MENERKAKVYELCEGLYSIMCDAVKPHNKERWMETVWGNVKDKSPKEFATFVEMTQGIIDYKDEDGSDTDYDTPNADTILAIQEVEALKKDPNKRVYSSFSEALEELAGDE